MKKSIILFVVLCGGIACAIVFLNKQKSAPPAPPVVETTPSQSDTTPSSEKATTPQPVPPSGMQPAAVESLPVKTVPLPVVAEAKADDSANAIHKAVDDLLSAKNGLDKHNLFQQLVKTGQIDAVIDELKQRAADNTNNAAIPTTLGEALLNKVRALHDGPPSADTMDEMGILAMQADKSFNTALKIDPQNWEAQFVKVSSMTYWPSEPVRDADIVQRFSTLIDQQDTMTPNPAFAQTYVMLGNQYQKMGQPDKAQATWQLGLTKFPNDPALQKKLNP